LSAAAVQRTAQTPAADVTRLVPQPRQSAQTTVRVVPPPGGNVSAWRCSRFGSPDPAGQGDRSLVVSGCGLSCGEHPPVEVEAENAGAQADDEGCTVGGALAGAVVRRLLEQGMDRHAERDGVDGLAGDGVPEPDCAVVAAR